MWRKVTLTLLNEPNSKTIELFPVTSISTTLPFRVGELVGLKDVFIQPWIFQPVTITVTGKLGGFFTTPEERAAAETMFSWLEEVSTAFRQSSSLFQSAKVRLTLGWETEPNEQEPLFKTLSFIGAISNLRFDEKHEDLFIVDYSLDFKGKLESVVLVTEIVTKVEQQKVNVESISIPTIVTTFINSVKRVVK